MEIIGAFVVSSLAGLATLIGAIPIFIKVKTENITKFIVVSLSFSLAIMIGISITDLIPSSSFVLLQAYGLKRGVIVSSISFTIGIIIIKFLNREMHKEKFSNDLYKLGILNMLALILHNFPEGIATFMSSYQDLTLGLKLGLAISLHNIPEGISIAMPIYYATHSKKEALFKTFLSAIAEPLGALLAYIFLAKYITNSLISLILLLVAGIMISLAIEVILPKAKSYNLNKHLYLGLMIGIILLLINYFLL